MTSDDHRLVAALRSALKENARLREELDHTARPEPIAIVGMGCRLPGGVDSPEALWELVVHGREAVGPLPEDRGWDLAALRGESGDAPRSSMAQGSFLDAAADFDPGLFNISPREAEAMDPQQRLLLEVAWETLERAGISPSSLKGTDAGVYVGTTGPEYGPRLSQAPADGLAMTGTALSVASGRIAYTLGLTGPAITMDTACSSSLVAVHMAVRALQAGECSLALAGGATVMSSPAPLTEFTHLGGLAADGRCKAFGAAADGAGFSEGVGLVTLERLSDARRAGHRVLAVIRGGAINQDGASNGLTAPNGPSQVRVVRKALSDAGLTAQDVDLVEAHGTGTTLGDPIEAQALLAAYGQERPADRPLWLGSLKSNIGHAQAAAGVAGLIKVVESLRHGVLPRTLHADEPTPHVDWESGAVRLLTREQAWPRTDRPGRAGISSFGMSGTNAHVIVEQAPEVTQEPRPARAAAPRRSVPWILSARDEESLRAQAARLRDHVLDHPDTDPADTGWSLARTRAALDHRAVVVAEDHAAFAASLRALAEGRPDPGTVLGRAGGDRRPVFVFPGQGGQWAGMAVELMGTSPRFADRLAECEKALAPFVDWSLTDVLRGRADAAAMDRVDVVQPVLWAVMVSLAELWSHHGVRPTAVVGHSQGEIAAACVAGALSLEDAAKVVALRSRALLELSGTGAMAAVAQRPDDVAERIAGLGGSVHLAAVNSPTSTVIAGEPEAVRSLVEEYEAKGVRARTIAVDYASHTPHVARIRERLHRELAGIGPRRPEIPMYSTLTGARLDDTALDADYWYRNLSNPVEFAQVTRVLLSDGHDVFVEVGPHPVLAAHVQETAESHGAPDTVVLDTIRRDDGGSRRFTVSLAQAHCHGVDVDWAEAFGDDPRIVDLPTYAFRRRRFWRAGGGDGSAPGAGTLPSADTRPGPDPAHDWVYREDWVPVEATTGRPAPSGTWLLFGSKPSDPVVTDMVAAFERGGCRTRFVDAPASADRDALAELLIDARRTTDTIAGVVALHSLDTTVRGGGVTRPTASTAHQSAVVLLQALGDAAVTAPLWCVTRGAVPAGGGVSDPSSALVWGLGRVAAQEHTDRWGGMVDLPPAEAPGEGEALVSVLTGRRGDAEDQLAIRDGAVLARRLVRAPIGRTGAVRRWEPSGTVLITGGTGALGAHTARRLARRGARHLLLLSRRGTEAPGAQALEAELRSIGAEVTITSCDVADRAALAAVLDGVPEQYPLRAVVHAAASLDDGAIDDLTPDQVACALRAKGDAAVHLHELTQGMDLSAFVVYSSVSAVFGVTGQGNYAPGNAFCEALVHHRRSLGLPATSIAWGAWAGGGMAEDTAVAELLQRHGLPTMDPDAAITMLERALDHDLPALAVADVDWPRFRAAFTANRPSPLLRDLGPFSAEGAGPDQAVTGGLEARLSGLGRDARRRALTEHVRREVAAILGYASGDELDDDRGYKELGMDSVTAIELRNRMSALTGLRLPAGLAYSHPTCAALGRHLEERLFGDPQRIVMTRIDSIEEALAEDEDSAMDREAVARRLQDLLKLLTPSQAGANADEDLESASREELFAFIDDALRD
ncbi:acyl transferase domain-containing protein [Nocardiopsis sp. Huas11]|uniref:type I polyketide synthase n=1 Tax=Nocardiopsis sp. Huas11 TaxID=2183912 RepID=UPI000EB3475A|nr:type I polyketide synthase [Nocardiopsis sp. Huas11]RKS10383.1 acyl transferase domain-containing protein [Nocardiopsis sp. Huas11]